MASSSKHDHPVPADSPPPATDDLTDHEIAVKIKLISKSNKNDERLGRSARRIRSITGDWPWVWLEDKLPKTWSFNLIENLDALIPYSDPDEFKTFLHDAVMQRTGKHRVLRLDDVKRAHRHFGLGGSSKAGDNNGAATNDEQHDDEDDEEFLSDKEAATSGKGKSTKRPPRAVKDRRLNKPVASDNHLDSEYMVEEEDEDEEHPSPVTIDPIGLCEATLDNAQGCQKEGRIYCQFYIFKKTAETTHAATSAADEKVAYNETAIATARDAIAKYQQRLAELATTASADTANRLVKSLEDANSARKAIVYGKAAFESNLVAMNMGGEVAEVVCKNYTDKLAATEGKIDDIVKQIEAEKVASAKVATDCAELQSKIEQRELKVKKLESKCDQYENEVMFWVSIRNIVSLGPEGMKSQGAPLDEVISSIKENGVVDVDNWGDSESESEIPATPQTSD